VIVQTILLALAIITGVRVHNQERISLRRPLPSLLWDMVVQWTSFRRGREPSRLPISFSTSHSPYFGERPHYYTPPSDMEQYRLRYVSSNRPIKSILTGEDRTLSYQHHYIPYPNDAPYTFPAIKARALFTKKPKHVKQVYIASVDPVQRTNLRTGAKLEVPFSQMEERFRTVYSNAERNQLLLTINATNENELRRWEREGLLRRSDKVYNFHHVDGLLSPPLSDVKPKKPILEPSWHDSSNQNTVDTNAGSNNSNSSSGNNNS